MTTMTYRANQGAHTTTITLEPDGSGWIRVEMLGTTDRLVDEAFWADRRVVDVMARSLHEALPHMPPFGDGPLVVSLGHQRRAMLEVDAPPALGPFLREARDLVALHGARGKRYTYTGHAARAGAPRDPATFSEPDNGIPWVAGAIAGQVLFLIVLCEFTLSVLRANPDNGGVLSAGIIGLGLSSFLVVPAVVASHVNKSPTARGMQTTFIAYSVWALYFLIRVPGLLAVALIGAMLGGLVVVGFLGSAGISLGEWLAKMDD